MPPDPSTETMRAVGVVRFGGPDGLEVVQVPTPHAGAGEIRMRVRAVAVSPSDVLIRHGRTPTTPGHMVIPGTDAAGVVDEIGPGAVTDLAVGDAVMAYVHPLGPDGGAYAEHVVLPADWVVRAPRGATSAEAATLPLNGLEGTDDAPGVQREPSKGD
jgi:NADPH:quinone reductase